MTDDEVWKKWQAAQISSPLNADEVQKAIDAAAQEMQRALEQKIHQALAIPLPPWTDTGAACTYSSSMKNTEVSTLARTLPEWIGHNRILLADDLWFAGEAFRRSIGAWAVYHRLGDYRFGRPPAVTPETARGTSPTN